MRLNNVRLDALSKTIQRIKADPQARRKSTFLNARWSFLGSPQFKATIDNGENKFELEADEAIEKGGEGKAPDPLSIFLFGVVSSFASTLVLTATLQGVVLNRLEIHARIQTNELKTFGLSDEPIVESLEIKVSSDFDQLKELVEVAKKRCATIFSITNGVSVEVKVE
ncbi:hypothetical protein B9Q11_01465 [Candidatus Marsarchaeota G2 archaeon ECH_B_SAG-F08]|jgi:uncharacterized OsmC-like protein|uniref:Osmotically inducible protein OsmC n=6 Tax=Candidatus Marsarchaeota TaxID=1978152 RepID=A0A2R6BK27_9ARCH|nr:MAG: hypothetical protein B9Q02_03035 [Candidatus Marsarchaeota G1 archaeon BE_D]PSN99001.1 MAG: hypothetical protein B9Q11_01425 [Candidatus Marsarchaeota G2 archaeon ECH_B_SAG-F08]PSO02463.1 MAG: hypothetical protein B9Q10_01315 [Candidatus Marsarchaeota G2 archaeon ECH_B_SAG-E12]PSO04614.1 MAG: hypothetical protein B9Q12_02055 [Candidatus Marsarchaeota G2 archaeon ECH_B_SAG-G06]PSO05780.1 MAG: hypothetical protein B9Q13_00880 [Candidatus Marsarchaeota G2 archaeon ECH_B_SAG-G16]